MNRTRITISASLAVAGTGLAFLLTHPNYLQVTERPVELAAPFGLPLKELSVALFTITIPYDTITKALNTAIMPSYPLKGRKELCGSLSTVMANGIKNNFGGDGAKAIAGFIGASIAIASVGATENKCFQSDYDTTVRRTADFATGMNKDALHVSVPLKLDGHVGLAGDIAAAAGMDKKSVRGEVTLFADVRTKIDADWCPTLEVTPDFRWTDGAKIEILGNAWGSLEREADAELRSAIGNAQRMLPNLLTCDFVRQRVSPHWKQYAFDLPKSAIEGQVVLTPRRIGISNIINKPEGLQVSFLMEAEIEAVLAIKDYRDAKRRTPIDPVPKIDVPANELSQQFTGAIGAATAGEHGTKLALPTLTQIPSRSTGFGLAAPISISYPILEELARRVVMNEPYELKTKVIDAKIAIKDLVVYPAGDRLVIGMKFDSDLSSLKSLAPNGWVYLTAKPVIDEEKGDLRLSQVSYARIIDNDLWNSVSYVFQGQIKSLIESKVAINLAPRMKPMQDEMRASLMDVMKKTGIQVVWQDTPVKLTRLEILKDGIRVVATLDGAADFVVLPAAVDAALGLNVQTPPPPVSEPPALAVVPSQQVKKYPPRDSMESPRAWMTR